MFVSNARSNSDTDSAAAKMMAVGDLLSEALFVSEQALGEKHLGEQLIGDDSCELVLDE